MRRKLEQAKHDQFVLRDDGLLLNDSRVYVPNVEYLREDILEEAHNAPYSMHPGSTKMYRNMKPFYWWPTMKKDVSEFVAKCLICQQVKAEHQAPAAFHPQTDGQSERTIQTLEDMIRACMAPYEALYGRKCRSPVCWNIEEMRQLEGPEIVQETVDKIRTVK
ncbi:uncharacterized protein LOC126687677 [Mercurialis annua]|uniref:uncharacterized protein LOC126687677 n=1 Tax=Mercurialis annua TaxID=3986 RepID=UPI00215F49B8|nr:uncharacterized protein LOC126687677 [Mercurialis annua]